MVIKFNCPNGHPLNTTEARAGKPGKCPKCGASFLVPTLEELAAGKSATTSENRSESAAAAASSASGVTAEASISAAASSLSVATAAAAPAAESAAPLGEGSGKIKVMAASAATSDAGKSAASKAEAPLPPDHIMFLCPNGHKLNGPKRLQGKPGQCPHCGAKFRIPDYDATDDEEPTSAPQDSGTFEDMPFGEMVGTGEIPIEDLEEIEEVEEFPQEEDLLDYAAELGEGELATEMPQANGEAHALSYLVSRLWREKTGPMELVLKAGGSLSPQYFSPELSQHNFAVFGLANDDGTYNIAVVAWDDIARVNVQRLKQLPKGVFE